MKDSETDKSEGNFDKAKGKVKEKFGQVTGNEDLENEGKKDQGKGDLKKAKGDVKDAFDK